MKQLQIGTPATQFAAKNIYGSEVKLDLLKGQRVYLSFLRTASCPFCNMQVHRLIQKQKDWKKKGIVTIAVFASSSESILQYAGKQNPTFIILADPDETLYKSYKIGSSAWGLFKAMLRVKTLMTIMVKGYFNMKTIFHKPVLTGDFLINDEGIIEHVYYGKDFGDHISFELIDNW
ncbi:MAG: redoxin domain-containing protein [Cyclobacteriaceae bacterium]